MQSEDHKLRKDFKYYNNSYLYVTFRDESLQKYNVKSLASNLVKFTAQKLYNHFQLESHNKNNKTRYDMMRVIRRKEEQELRKLQED